MELVSANTKEFLYVTLSQYNEKPTLERARVQMRRDEPFWQGGNSYIACESFRISASPNPGGLYYKKIPEDWFMGANGGSEQNLGGNAVTFIPVANAANAAHTSILFPVDSKNLGTTQEEGVKIMLALRLGTNAQHLLTISEPALVFDELAGFFGHVLKEGSVCRVTLDTGASASAPVIHSPQPYFTASGGGPSGMYFPQANTVRIATGALIAAGGDCCTLNISNLDIGEDDMSAFSEMVGRGSYLQSVSQTDGATHVQSGAGGGYFDMAYYRVLGPHGLAVNADFTGVEPLYSNGTLNYYCYWEGPLRVGIPITCLTRVQPDAGHQHIFGTVSAIPDFMSRPYNRDGQWTVEPTQLLLNHIGGNHNHKANVLTQQTHDSQFIFTCTPLNWTGTILTTCAVQMIPMAPDEYVTNLEIVSPADHPIEQQKEWLRRGPDVAYTPGEFMQFFNRPEHTDMTATPIKPPWTLTTDVNGGFVIVWSPKAPAFFSEFLISRQLHDALGLNDFFECETRNQITARVDPQLLVTCKRMDLLNQPSTCDLTSRYATLHPSDLYERDQDGALTPFAQAVIPDMITYTSDGAQWKVISSEQIRRQSTKERIRKFFAGVRTDPITGQEFLHYQNLPTNAYMRNRQQVSLESFQTFNVINLVVPNLPFQPMLGTETDERILASLRIPFPYANGTAVDGSVSGITQPMMGDLLWNSDDSRSYLKITTDQELYDLDIEARLIRRDGSMEVMKLPYQGQFQVKVRFLQVQ